VGLKRGEKADPVPMKCRSLCGRQTRWRAAGKDAKKERLYRKYLPLSSKKKTSKRKRKRKKKKKKNKNSDMGGLGRWDKRREPATTTLWRRFSIGYQHPRRRFRQRSALSMDVYAHQAAFLLA